MTDDPTALDDEDAEAKTLRHEAKRARERDDLRWLMAHAQGRRFVWRQLSEAGVFHEGFSSDLAVMSRNAGRRSMGLQLLGEVMEHTPALYQKMIEEAGKLD